MMISNNSFLIRSASPCSLNSVALIFQPGLDQSIPSHMLEEASSEWDALNRNRQSQGKPALLDLPLFRPGKIHPKDNQIRIECGITSYRTATCLARPCTSWNDPYTGAGLSVVPVCQDNQILIGRRSKAVHQGQGQFHVAAGHAHPQPDFKTRPDKLIESVLQELNEEMAIQSTDIHSMEFLGIGLNLTTSKSEFLIRVILKEDSDIYIKRWKTRFLNRSDREFDETTTVNEIINNDAFECHREKFTIACRMALEANGINE